MSKRRIVSALLIATMPISCCANYKSTYLIPKNEPRIENKIACGKRRRKRK